MASVQPSESVDGPDTGGVTAVTIEDGNLLLHRAYGFDAFDRCQTLLSEDLQECLKTARKSVKRVLDVFPMETIEMDSQPSFRVELYEQYGCTFSRQSTGALRTESGRITYTASDY